MGIENLTVLFSFHAHVCLIGYCSHAKIHLYMLNSEDFKYRLWTLSRSL